MKRKIYFSFLFILSFVNRDIWGMDIKDEDEEIKDEYIYEKEKEFNDNYYLGDENGFLIVNEKNNPFYFKIYKGENFKEKVKIFKYSNLYYEGKALFFNENNEIICIIANERYKFFIKKKEKEEEEEQSIIECNVFKKNFSNDLKLVCVQNDSLVKFDKKVIFSLLPYNYLKQDIHFVELQYQNKKILTNAKGHPLLASIKKDEIILYHINGEDLVFNEKKTILED